MSGPPLVSESGLGARDSGLGAAGCIQRQLAAGLCPSCLSTTGSAEPRTPSPESRPCSTLTTSDPPRAGHFSHHAYSQELQGGLTTVETSRPYREACTWFA